LDHECGYVDIYETSYDRDLEFSPRLLQHVTDYLRLANSNINGTNITIRRWLESKGYDLSQYHTNFDHRHDCDGTAFTPLEKDTSVMKYALTTTRFISYLLKEANEPSSYILNKQQKGAVAAVEHIVKSPPGRDPSLQDSSMPSARCYSLSNASLGLRLWQVVEETPDHRGHYLLGTHITDKFL
jgi:hypothetical protein